MPRYEVTVSESRDLTYIVEADDLEEAKARAGELWCEDAEPYHTESSFDFAGVVEVA
jgi:hypothetical protein